MYTELLAKLECGLWKLPTQLPLSLAHHGKQTATYVRPSVNPLELCHIQRLDDVANSEGRRHICLGDGSHALVDPV